MSEISVNGQNSQPDVLSHSPVQEHHIDFLLEEEFACNPAFLDFFIREAIEHFNFSAEIPDKNIIEPASQWNCKAIRSVMTNKGETDVLAIYRSKDESKRIAVLIEDKIRAGFQPEQAERYRERGEKGKKDQQWDSYWTCLISPEKYAPDNRGFDTRIPLEKFVSFFAKGDDPRSHFKLQVMEAALKHFSETGVQQLDETMTEFRKFYAEEASRFFENDEIQWAPPRDAYRGDYWFRFKSSTLPSSSYIEYKAPKGYVDLTFPNQSVTRLQKVLEICSNSPEINAEQTGKSASFRFIGMPVNDFGNHSAAKPAVIDSFEKVRELVAFFKKNELLINDELGI